jgi:hypothetical protein
MEKTVTIKIYGEQVTANRINDKHNNPQPNQPVTKIKGIRNDKGRITNMQQPVIRN